MKIDFDLMGAKKFIDWISYFVTLPPEECNGVKYSLVEFIVPGMITLVEKNVFSLDEIRNELRRANISIHEKYFKAVEKICKTKLKSA